MYSPTAVYSDSYIYRASTSSSTMDSVYYYVTSEPSRSAGKVNKGNKVSDLLEKFNRMTK